MKPFVKIDDASVVFPSAHQHQSLKNLLVGRHRVSPTPKRMALSSVSVELVSGERLGIIGRNGSGKTTLLKVIAGILPPTEGRRVVRGEIAPVISQGLGFDPTLPVRLNIRLGLLHTNRAQDYTLAFERHVLEFAELTEYANEPAAVLSSGMQSRLAFALALFQTPQILLLDEVFATGDAAFIKKAEAAMLERIDQTPIVVLVSHSPPRIARVATRCILLDQGHILADGPPGEIAEKYKKLTAA